MRMQRYGGGRDDPENGGHHDEGPDADDEHASDWEFGIAHCIERCDEDWFADENDCSSYDGR